MDPLHRRRRGRLQINLVCPQGCPQQHVRPLKYQQGSTQTLRSQSLHHRYILRPRKQTEIEQITDRYSTDNFEGLIPNYLKFIRGVVDSDDLDLNVSREILQQTSLLKLIEKRIVRKSIAMFQEMAQLEDKSLYKEFWEGYGTNIKLGVIEDSINRSRLSKLLM